MTAGFGLAAVGASGAVMDGAVITVGERMAMGPGVGTVAATVADASVVSRGDGLEASAAVTAAVSGVVAPVVSAADIEEASVAVTAAAVMGARLLKSQ